MVCPWHRETVLPVRCIMESQITNGSDRSLYGGSAIKAYSRRIGSTCLSSAEAETFSIVEAAHECRGISLMAETFWNGLPKRAPNGDFETISGKMVSNTKTAMMGTMSASAAVLTPGWVYARGEISGTFNDTICLRSGPRPEIDPICI